MITALDGWLREATRCLAPDSVAQVRSEICEHYESAREAALMNGATPEEADRGALHSLGNPRTANSQYRKVLLTASEMRILRQSNWEARIICSRAWIKRVVPLLLPAAFLTSAILMLQDGKHLASPFFCIAIFLTAIVGAPFLPVYTPARARVYRLFKWVALAGAIALTSGWSERALLFSSLSPVFWIEWQRAAIRRKLPIARWPKQLYL